MIDAGGPDGRPQLHGLGEAPSAPSLALALAVLLHEGEEGGWILLARAQGHHDPGLTRVGRLAPLAEGLELLEHAALHLVEVVLDPAVEPRRIGGDDRGRRVPDAVGAGCGFGKDLLGDAVAEDAADQRLAEADFGRDLGVGGVTVDGDGVEDVEGAEQVPNQEIVFRLSPAINIHTRAPRSRSRAREGSRSSPYHEALRLDILLRSDGQVMKLHGGLDEFEPGLLDHGHFWKRLGAHGERGLGQTMFTEILADGVGARGDLRGQIAQRRAGCGGGGGCHSAGDDALWRGVNDGGTPGASGASAGL